MPHLTCAWDGCERTEILARGLCDRDYRRARAAGTVEDYSVTIRVCSICGESFSAGKHGIRFCSDDCREVEFHRMLRRKREERRAARSGRVCAVCGEPVDDGLRADAMHCSITCQQAAWYSEESVRLRAAAKLWAQRNPDLVNESHQRRRAAVYGVDAEKIDRAEVWRSSEGICAICSDRIDPDVPYPGPLSRSIDHIIPLSRGGAHVRANVQMTHLVCNLKKGVSITPERV